MTTNKTNATPRGTEMFNKRMMWLNTFMGDVEKRHDKYVEQDPNQYFIMDKPNYYKKMVKQYETGEATGNCFQDHTKDYVDLCMKTILGEETIEDYKFIWFEFNNPNTGEYHRGCHSTILVKINNLWYARDNTNYIKEQRCVFEYFRDRSNMNIFGVWEVEVKVWEDGVGRNNKRNICIKLPNENNSKDKPINMEHYWHHNIIVNTLRKTATYSDTR